MSTIDRHWIAKKIGTHRGAQAALAGYIGITPDKMSKVMNGTRNLKGQEIIKVLEFFQNHHNLPKGDGFNEPAADTHTARLLKTMVIGETSDENSVELETKIAIKGKYAQIAATVDKTEIRRLIDKLKAIEAILDDPNE